MITDISLYESGQGGEFVLLPNDIGTTGALWNNIYLALFGGNVESDHEDEEETEGLNLDYWQNNLFFPEDTTGQLVSLTELTLTKTTITSKGLNDLETVVKTDLNYLKEIGDLSVSVEQTGVDKISINIKVNQTEISYIWDNTLNEVITNQEVGGIVFIKPTPVTAGFAYGFPATL